MGFLNRLKRSIAKKQQTVKVSWLGLDHAGKTTIIRRLTSGEFDEALVNAGGWVEYADAKY